MTESKQTGNAGESGVKSAFERIGWGVADNCRHDLGTDLLVAARDERLFELGHVLGVQVKTRSVGASPGKYFRRPELDPETGDTVGWWYHDGADGEDISGWVRHTLPHLLVLHDLNDATSYWVAVTPDAVVETGRGKRILVPRRQTIDLEHRAALLTVASALRPRVEWEGGSWAGPRSIAPRDLLRHALIVPRLVAPHPQRELTEPLGPEQALALLARIRPLELERRLGLDVFDDDLGAALDRPEWPWRLAKAFHDFLYHGDIEVLAVLVDDAATPSERTAVVVMTGAGLLAEGLADRAVELLDTAAISDDADPVDNAWLALQHARGLSEIGRVDEARAQALTAYQIRSTVADDITASAIAGQAAVLLFHLAVRAGRGPGDVAAVAAGADTTAAWWRSLTVTDGLTASLTTAFTAWSRAEVITIGGRDHANDDLVAARLMAAHLGDHGAWCGLARLHSLERLARTSRDSDVDTVRAALRALRHSGDKKSMDRAVARIVRDGPADAAAAAAREIDLQRLTDTNARASLALLRGAGDVLDHDTAHRTCDWVFNVLDNPTTFLRRVDWRWSRLRVELIDTLTAIAGAAPPPDQTRMARYLAELHEELDSFDAGGWARLARTLPTATWSPALAGRLAAGAASHSDELRTAALEIAAAHDPSQRETLLALVESGSFTALGAYGDVRDLPRDTVRRQIDRLVEQCTRTRSEAARMSFSEGPHDPGRDLVLLNSWHPACARWEPLCELLEDPAVWPAAKNPALDLLARLAARLPDDVRPRLLTIATNLTGRGFTPAALVPTFEDQRATTGPALALAVALSGPSTPLAHEPASRLMRLLSGTADDRRWFARIAGHGNDPALLGAVVGLARDDDHTVRGVAAAGLLAHLARIGSDGSPIVRAALEQALDDPGTTVALHLVSVLTDIDWPQLPGLHDLVLAKLSSHRSAVVRQKFTAIADGDGPDHESEGCPDHHEP